MELLEAFFRTHSYLVEHNNASKGTIFQSWQGSLWHRADKFCYSTKSSSSRIGVTNCGSVTSYTRNLKSFLLAQASCV